MDFVKALTTFASQDSTRYYLNGIYRDQEYFVSTDGHRLFQTAHHNLPNHTLFKPEFIYESKAFELGAMKTIDGKYPDVKPLFPDVTRIDSETKKPFYKSFDLTIPHWVAGIKPHLRKNHQLPRIGITAEGDLTTSPNALVHFNLGLIAPLAGETCKAFVRGATGPILLQAPDWKVLVMPLRR